jgi:hypothetical protein
MEMTPVWKERKSKSPFPLFPHCLGKLANTPSLPHSHSFGDDLGFLFSTSSFNFNFDESVTDMPGTFCYRHARSLNKALFEICSKPTDPDISFAVINNA